MIFYLEKLTILLALFFLWRQFRPHGWGVPTALAAFAAVEAYLAIDYLLMWVLPAPPA